MLSEGQVQVRDLVMGPGTPYTIRDFNPFSRKVRADQGGPRAWADGTWSGAEFLDELVIPMNIFTQGATRDSGSWLTEHFKLMAAFDPVRDGISDVTLRFMIGGVEYVVFGRPRVVDPNVETLGIGKAFTEAAFVANDPHIYSGDEQISILGLPKYSDGLTAPLHLPMYVDATKTDGETDIQNQGISETFLLARIDGPVSVPRFSISDPDGNAETLRILFDLLAGQFVEINTGNNTVLFNGTSNRRNQVTGNFPRLKPGTSALLFNSDVFSDSAQLTVRWRHAW